MKGHLMKERMEWDEMQCSGWRIIHSEERERERRCICGRHGTAQHSTAQHSSEEDKGIGTEEKKRRLYVRQCPTPLVRWSHNVAAAISFMLLRIIVAIVHYT